MSKLTDALKKAAEEAVKVGAVAAKEILGAKDAKDALRQSTIGKEKKGKGSK